MTATELIAFEAEVARRYEAGEIRGPVHLCSPSQAEPLIEIFKDISKDSWIFSTWRSHFHALLHGIPPEKVMDEILAGRSMNLNFPEHRFLTSAIVGGILPIAVGVAWTGHHVWCFVGDMTAVTGAFAEANQFSLFNGLPIRYVIEDNNFSTNTPTGDVTLKREAAYTYERQWPHVGSGTFVRF